VPLTGDRVPSPAGELALVVNAAGTLVRVWFLLGGGVEELERELAAQGERVHWDSLDGSAAKVQLAEYAARRRRVFELELAPRGTPFQRAVWEELRRVPYGATATYGDIARALGRPQSSRAVGQANHENPLPVVIPCHRVVGADGTLTGFGGGLEAKRALLDFESGQGGLWEGSRT